MEHLRSTRAEINLDNLKYNIGVLREELGPDVEPMAIIKADCYGHGAVIMMEYMMKYGLRYFGVASLNEALELRRFHKDGEILVLGLSPDSILHYGVENDIVQTICSLHQAEVLSALGKPAKVQIKVDTGMHRLGFAPTEENMDVVAQIAKLPNIVIRGIFSHLALETHDDDYRQWEKFQRFIDGCEMRGVTFPLKSLDDGIGSIRYPEMRYNMVRPGSFFYGFNPHISTLRPLMELKSEIVHLQMLPAGEGLGYRHPPLRLCGRRAPRPVPLPGLVHGQGGQVPLCGSFVHGPGHDRRQRSARRGHRGRGSGLWERRGGHDLSPGGFHHQLQPQRSPGGSPPPGAQGVL